MKETLKLIEQYRKEHKKDWYDFAKGFLLGYMSDRPEYEEASLREFKEWLEEKVDLTH